MKSILSAEDLSAFLVAMDKPCPTSIRLNNKKTTNNISDELHKNFKIEDADKKVYWCEEGLYLKERPSFTMDPLFHAGVYYVQEASSMFIAHLINKYIGSRDITALDLCAAPGGKSTLLLSYLSNNSTLIANEIMPKRAQILRENITKWGAGNTIVTNNKSEDFRHLQEVFDLILCDLPCSGEGMFRKDANAITEWSAQNVEICWKRQREIVENIWDGLKPGGLIIYSTCTYNTKENEENVKWISETLGAEILPCDVKANWNIMGNLLEGETFDCCHFMPHKIKGEGFFCAILRKEGNANVQAVKITDKLLKGLKVLPVENVMENSIAKVDVDKLTALKYLRGEALKFDPDIPKGPITITYKEQPLGMVKNIGNRANNLLPKGWRIRKQI